MKIVFNYRKDGLESLACEADIHFEEGPLQGMKLVGFSLWKSPKGEMYVNFPARAFGTGGERRFFDYLRAVEGDMNGPAKRVKGWILEEYKKQQAHNAL